MSKANINQSSQVGGYTTPTYKVSNLRCRFGRILFTNIICWVILGAIAGLAIGFADKFPAKIADLLPELALTEAMIYSVVAALAVAFVFSILRFIFKRGADRRSAKRFAIVTAKLALNRGAIVVDSLAKPKKKHGNARRGGRGHLYLTPTALEFYNKKFANKPQKNFLIMTRNVIEVRVGGCRKNKIFISCADGSVQTFIVPIGTAFKWKKAILETKNAAQYIAR